jgi:hypothetical protein
MSFEKNIQAMSFEETQQLAKVVCANQAAIALANTGLGCIAQIIVEHEMLDEYFVLGRHGHILCWDDSDATSIEVAGEIAHHVRKYVEKFGTLGGIRIVIKRGLRYFVTSNYGQHTTC